MEPWILLRTLSGHPEHGLLRRRWHSSCTILYERQHYIEHLNEQNQLGSQTALAQSRKFSSSSRAGTYSSVT